MNRNIERINKRKSNDNIILQVKDLNVYYGSKKVVRNLNIEIFKNYITAVMGPSGCGKTTFIRTLNRMHEFTPNTKVEGSIILNGQVLDKMDPILVRRRIGMVFQKPNPFPTMNIHDNVIAGYILNGIRIDRKSTRLNSSHIPLSRMPSSA